MMWILPEFAHTGSNLTATVKNNSLQSGFYGLLWDASSGLATGNMTTLADRYSYPTGRAPFQETRY